MDRSAEIHEAIETADAALEHLRAAQDYLESAGNWGVWDILGGGFFATLIKHGKMEDAQRELDLAKTAVKRFGQELRDVQQTVHIQLETGDFIHFSDLFFDGFLSDWLVQSRIREAEQQVEYAIRQISAIQKDLHRVLTE